MMDQGPEGDQEERHLAPGSRGSILSPLTLVASAIVFVSYWLPGADFFKPQHSSFSMYSFYVHCLMFCAAPEYTAWSFNQCKQYSSSGSTMQGMQPDDMRLADMG